MIDYLAQYGLFLAKSITWVAAILIVVSGVVASVRALREQAQERLEIKSINRRFENLGLILSDELDSPFERKRQAKLRRREEKARAKAEKKSPTQRPRLFVLNFDGDIQASAVVNLREEISAVLQVAKPEDEVLLRLESGGGLVHGYGLAASQLTRIRDRGLKLTVSVDKVAASGGYLMACVAQKILAAPFAIVGSIGVVAQLPNFHRWLEKHDVDFELHTAGDHKRTLTLFGQNTEEGRAKFREEIEQTHELFKHFVAQHRPQLDLTRVATGEHWFGSQALELQLVDELRTSDDYLLARIADADAYELKYRHRQKLSERVAHGMTVMAQVLRGRWGKVENRLF